MKNLVALFILFIFFGCNMDHDSQNANKSSKTKPNILWLVAEDLSPMIPSFGDSTIQTPNLSRLAAEGVRYTNVYSVSGVCAPSRAGICTGMYPSSIGAHHMRTQWHADWMKDLGLTIYEAVPPPAVKMMSEVLRKEGYYCSNNDKTDYQFVPTVTAWDESSAYAHWRNREEGQPFFAIFNFDITHESQVFAPSGKKNLRFQEPFPQNPETNPVPGWNDRLDSSEWKLNVPVDLDVSVPPYLADTEGTKNDIRRVYSNIIEMDRQVGVILQQLEEDGELENTIIFWYTDHGGPLPRQKRLLYDSGLKLPLIVRYPEQKNAGTIDDQLISFIDFAPTTFSMAGIKPGTHLQGQAFAGVHKVEQERKYIHAAADRFDKQYDMIRAVKDKRFKYLKNFKPEKGYYLPIAYRENMIAMQDLLKLRQEGKLTESQALWFRDSKPEEELFDTENDPHELHNLANDPVHAQKLTELRNECNRWMKTINDKGHIPEGDLISSFWPEWEQPDTDQPLFIKEGNKIQLSCPTPGSSIGYKIIRDKVEPKSWQVYRGAFEIPEGATVKAIADRIGYKPSEDIQITP